MQIREIKDSAVFDSFVENSSNNHYMKTSMWGEFEQKQAKRSYQMLGFYEKDRLAATALVLKGSWFGHPYLYIPKGPCMDYYDETARREVFTLLKQYADQQHVLFLRIDPNILRCARTIDGKLIAGGENHEDVTESLKRLGYTHKGYGYAYNGSWTNRFTLIVDLHEDMKTIRSRFSSRRKRCLKRCEEFHISTRTGSAEDIPTILDLQMQLVHQKSFQPSTSAGYWSRGSGSTYSDPFVACQRDGTTVLPRAWDHLEVLSSMTVLVSGVNGDAPTLPVGGAFDDEGVRP